jgi:hypothetical protein
MELSDRFEALASAPGVSKSSILEQAVNAFLNRKGDNELELRFAKRLDQISRQLDRIERNNKILIETTSLFIRYMLSVTGPLAADDAEGRAIARKRFEAFVERVKQQLASGGTSFDPETMQ